MSNELVKSLEMNEKGSLFEHAKRIYEQEAENGKELSNLAAAYYYLVDQFLDVIETSGWEEWLKYYMLEKNDKDERHIDNICTLLTKGANAGLKGYKEIVEILVKVKDLFPSEIEHKCCGIIMCPNCLEYCFENDEYCWTCGNAGDGQIEILKFLNIYNYRVSEFQKLDTRTVLNKISDFFEIVDSEIEDRYLLSLKPSIPVSSMDSNIYNILGAARRALIRRGKYKESDEIVNRVHSSGSYEMALAIIMEYVDFE